MPITLLDVSAVIYIMLGSTSIGYLLLRTGWPSVRTLEHPLKVGSSVLAGIIFTILAAIAGYALSIYFPMQTDFYNYIFASLPLMVFLLFAIMLLKQKFLGKRKVKVSVPKEDIAAKQIAEETAQRIIPEESYIGVRSELSQQQLEEIKKALKEDVEKEQKASE